MSSFPPFAPSGGRPSGSWPNQSAGVAAITARVGVAGGMALRSPADGPKTLHGGRFTSPRPTAPGQRRRRRVEPCDARRACRHDE